MRCRKLLEKLRKDRPILLDRGPLRRDNFSAPASLIGFFKKAAAQISKRGKTEASPVPISQANQPPGDILAGDQ
jgi:hypothetical protein